MLWQRALLVSVLGTLAAGIATLALGVRYDANTPTVVGFGFGVAVVGFVLSVGLFGWTYRSDADGDGLYLYAATVAAMSVLTFVSVVSVDDAGDTGVTIPLVLVGAASLVVAGAVLVFVERVRATAG